MSTAQKIKEEYDLKELAEEFGCKCGVPHCPGHEMIDGEIHIPNHPLGYLIVHNHPDPTDA